MKIATFNVWNNKTSWENRLHALTEEISRVNPDIIALQEVPGSEECQLIASMVNMPFYNFKKYPDEREGLAFLGKLPMNDVLSRSSELNECAYRITLHLNGLIIGITNVHLDWRSVSVRERQILTVTEWISKIKNTNFELLCGDFNSIPNVSSIYNYLVGEQSLQLKDTKWVDLAQHFQHPTLDFINNPWLHNRDKLNDARVPVRFDWILLQSCYPAEEPTLNNIELFGNSPVSGLFPSDHYGVLTEITFE